MNIPDLKGDTVTVGNKTGLEDVPTKLQELQSTHNQEMKDFW